MAFFLTVAMLAAAGDPKDAPKGVPENLKGDWRITSTADGKGFVTCGSAGFVLKIGDGSAEWKEIPKFSDKPGEATITAQGKDNEGTLELKVGDKVYKGIYRVTPNGGREGPLLDILLGAEGKPAPAAFPNEVLKLPADAVFKMQCDRKK